MKAGIHPAKIRISWSLYLVFFFFNRHGKNSVNAKLKIYNKIGSITHISFHLLCVLEYRGNRRDGQKYNNFCLLCMFECKG